MELETSVVGREVGIRADARSKDSVKGNAEKSCSQTSPEITSADCKRLVSFVGALPRNERLIAALVPSTASTTAPMDDAREMGAKVREFSANRERVLVGLMSEGRQGPERQ
jgi:hypothetical protein